MEVVRAVWSFAVLLLPGLAFGQLLPIPSSPVDDPMDAFAILCQIGSAIFYILIVVSIFMALIAAYRYLTSGGDESAVSQAHKTLTYAAVGVAVAILAWGMPKLVGWVIYRGAPPGGLNC
jgi:uncharacterized membrane protein